MTICVQTALFLAGMGLCVQWVAALYGIIDRGYCLQTRPRQRKQVMADILLWSAVSGTVFWLLDEGYRPAFVGGYGTFVLFHIGTFLGTKLVIRWKMRVSTRR